MAMQGCIRLVGGALPRAALTIRALTLVLATTLACRASAQAPDDPSDMAAAEPTAAAPALTAEEQAQEIDQVADALRTAGIEPRRDGERLLVTIQSDEFHDEHGEMQITFTLSAFDRGHHDRRWLRVRSEALNVFYRWKNPDAGRRALLEAADRLPTDAQFVSDPLTGEIFAQTCLPLGEGFSPDHLLDTLHMLRWTAEALVPVLDRAMDRGHIEWLRCDGGPDPERLRMLRCADARDLVGGFRAWLATQPPGTAGNARD